MCSRQRATECYLFLYHFLIAENQRWQWPVSCNNLLPGSFNLSHGDTESGVAWRGSKVKRNGDWRTERKSEIGTFTPPQKSLVRRKAKSCDVLISVLLISPRDWLSGLAFSPPWQPLIGPDPQVFSVTHSTQRRKRCLLWRVSMATARGGQAPVKRTGAIS